MARKGQENLIPLNKRSKERQREIQQMGRDANKAKMEHHKDLMQAFKAIMGVMLPTKTGEMKTVADALAMDTAKRALNGDPKARQQLFDILVGKKQEVDLKSTDGSMSPLDVTVKFVKPKPEE